MHMAASKSGYEPVAMDYFVGGYPNSLTVELGSLLFFHQDNRNHNVTGRLFEAESNKTFDQDAQITAYQGYGIYNK